MAAVHNLKEVIYFAIQYSIVCFGDRIEICFDFFRPQ